MTQEEAKAKIESAAIGVGVEVVNQLISYLATKAYHEVAHLIDMLTASVEHHSPKPEAPAVPPEEVK